MTRLFASRTKATVFLPSSSVQQRVPQENPRDNEGIPTGAVHSQARNSITPIYEARSVRRPRDQQMYYAFMSSATPTLRLTIKTNSYNHSHQGEEASSTRHHESHTAGRSQHVTTFPQKLYPREAKISTAQPPFPNKALETTSREGRHPKLRSRPVPCHARGRFTSTPFPGAWEQDKTPQQGVSWQRGRVNTRYLAVGRYFTMGREQSHS